MTPKRRIKMVLFDPTSDLNMEVVEMEVSTTRNELQAIYEWIECSTIDIVQRKMNGRIYDFIVDDEGLLKDRPIMSAVHQDETPSLFGLTLITKHDEEGNNVGLNEEEIIDVLSSRQAFYRRTSFDSYVYSALVLD